VDLFDTREPSTWGFPDPAGTHSGLRPVDAHLSVSRDNKTTLPEFDVQRLKQMSDLSSQRRTTRQPQPEEQKSMIGPRLELANIGEIEVLRDQEALASLSRLPHIWVRPTHQSFRPHGVDQVAQGNRGS
jgi:hypothetical protein